MVHNNFLKYLLQTDKQINFSPLNGHPELFGSRLRPFEPMVPRFFLKDYTIRCVSSYLFLVYNIIDLSFENDVQFRTLRVFPQLGKDVHTKT